MRVRVTWYKMSLRFVARDEKLLVELPDSLAGYWFRKIHLHGLSKPYSHPKLIAGIPNIAGIPQIPFRIPKPQWKICEKFDRVSCFPKRTIRQHCLHKAFGIALMRAAGVAAWETLYQKFIKNHAFIYTAAESDKNSLNPVRTKQRFIGVLCCCVTRRSGGKGIRKFLGVAKRAGKFIFQLNDNFLALTRAEMRYSDRCKLTLLGWVEISVLDLNRRELLRKSFDSEKIKQADESLSAS